MQKKQKRWYNRIHHFMVKLMILTIISGVLLPTISYADEENSSAGETPKTEEGSKLNAKDRVQAIYQFFKDKEANKFASKDNEDGFTEQEWQLLGTFLSNIFVPYQTYLTTKANDSGKIELNEKDVDNITKLLVSGIGMPEENAKSLASGVLSNMVDPNSYGKNFKEEDKTTQRLYLGRSNGGKAEPIDGRDVPLNYYDFLGVVLQSKPMQTVLRENFKITGDVAVYWKSGSENKTVLTLRAEGTPTPGQAAMASAFLNSSVKNSVSNQFMGNEKFKTDTDVNNVKNVYNKSMYGWKMYVDPFGNLISDTGEKRYIILPAAMNPTLYSLEGEKDTVGSFNNQYIPLNNIQSLVYAANGNIKEKDYGHATYKLPSENWMLNDSKIEFAPKSIGSEVLNFFTGGLLGKNGVYNKDTPFMKLTKDQYEWGNEKKGNEYNSTSFFVDQLNTYHYLNVFKKPNVKVSALLSVNKGVYLKTDLGVTNNQMLNDIVKETGTKNYHRPYIFSSLKYKKLKDEKENSGWSYSLDKSYTSALDIVESGALINSTRSGEYKNVSNGSTLYPWQINFTIGNNSSTNYQRLVVVPPSTLSNTEVFNTMGSLALIDTEKFTGSSETIKLLDLAKPDDFKTMVEKVNKDMGDSLNGELNQKITGDLGKELSFNILMGYANQALGKGATDRDGHVPEAPEVGSGGAITDTPTTQKFVMSWKQEPKFNKTLDFGYEKDKKGTQEIVSPKKVNTVLDFAYNFLSPISGVKFVSTWLKNKLNGVLLSWHEDITGANSSSYITGKTKYDNLNGFIYQQTLSDISFTNWLKNNFSKFAIYIIIIMFFALVLYFIRGDLTLQQAMIGFIIFVLLIQVPMKMVDGIITKTNQINTLFYKNKFDYFAVFQMENYMEHIENGASAAGNEEQTEGGTEDKDKDKDKDKEKDKEKEKDTTNDSGSKEKTEESEDKQEDNSNESGSSGDSIVKSDNIEKADITAEDLKDESTYEQALTKASNTEAGAGLSVRWLMPKKDNYQGELQTAISNNLNTSNSFWQLLTGAGTKDRAKQEINGYTNNLYVTRQVSDISAYSRTIYNNILGSGQNHATSSPTDVLNASSKEVSVPVKAYLTDETPASFKGRLKNGFINKSENGLQGQTEEYKHAYGVLLSESVGKATNLVPIKDITPTTVLGLPSRDFNATYGDYNLDAAAFKEAIQYKGDKDAQTQDENTQTSNVETNPEIVAGTGVFAIYSESPFYHIAWNFYDLGMKSTVDGKGSMKDLLLGPEDGKSNFFYNKELEDGKQGYNELKDFTDMGTLFRVTIPYLHRLNQQFKDFTDKYGAEPYKGISLLGPEQNGIKEDDPDYFKYFYNYNFARLSNSYSPWVDLMYDADYAQPEKIKYAGKTFTVKDPLNPASYDDVSADMPADGNPEDYKLGRPMIFSESEMKYYGLEMGDLTKVEQKIINYNKNTRQALLPLMNYYTFHDVTMTTVMALTATFEFNKEFSQSKITGYSIELQPTGWDIGGLSYDSFLRLILANATGEHLNYVKGGSTGGINSKDGTYETEAGYETKDADGNIALSKNDANGNIYERVLAGSGPLVGFMIVLNDIISVWLVPVLRFIFLMSLVILSLLIIITGVLSIGANLYSLLLKAILKPLIWASLATVGYAFIISLFLSNGPSAVTDDLFLGITFGPGITLFFLLILSGLLAFIYIVILIKMYQNIINIGSIAFNAVKYVASIGTGLVSGMTMGAAGKLNTAVNGTTRGTGITDADLGRNTRGAGSTFGPGRNNGTFGGGGTPNTNVNSSNRDNELKRRNKMSQRVPKELQDVRNAKQFDSSIEAGKKNIKKQNKKAQKEEVRRNNYQPKEQVQQQTKLNKMQLQQQKEAIEHQRKMNKIEKQQKLQNVDKNVDNGNRSSINISRNPQNLNTNTHTKPKVKPSKPTVTFDSKATQRPIRSNPNETKQRIARTQRRTKMPGMKD